MKIERGDFRVHGGEADDKEETRLIISQIILDTLQALNLQYPKTTAARRRELADIGRQLAK